MGEVDVLVCLRVLLSHCKHGAHEVAPLKGEHSEFMEVF